MRNHSATFVRLVGIGYIKSPHKSGNNQPNRAPPLMLAPLINGTLLNFPASKSVSGQSGSPSEEPSTTAPQAFGANQYRAAGRGYRQEEGQICYFKMAK